MTMTYLEEQVHIALRAVGGNKTMARQELISMAANDARLLLELTRHHLNGIAAYHIDRVASGRTGDRVAADARKRQPEQVAIDPNEKFGLEILKALAGTDTKFGLEAYSSPQRKGQASQRHINAIRKMASKSNNPDRF